MTHRSHPSRRSIVAAVAVAALGLAACGSRPLGSSNGPAHIKVAGGATTTVPRTALATGTEDKQTAGAATAMYPYQPIEYVVQGTLPELDGNGAAWRYPSSPKISDAQVTELARALGVTGALTRLAADDGGGWEVAAGTGPSGSLMVQHDAAGTWWTPGGIIDSGPVACASAGSSGSAGSAVAPDQASATPASPPAGGAVVTTVPASDAGGAATPPSGSEPAMTVPSVDCPQPTPPAGVPTADQARAKAVAFAAKIGRPVDGEVQVTADAYAAHATWRTSLGGLADPLEWSASWGGNGVLSSASGHLARPVLAEPYPRIGTTKAIELLKSGAGFYGGPVPAVGIAASDMPASATASASASGSGAAPTAIAPSATDLVPTTLGSVPVTKGIPATAPAGADGIDTTAPVCPPDRPTCTTDGPTTTIAPRQVAITGVEPALLPVYAADGDIWLVPAYRFHLSEGEIVVSAIDASYLETDTSGTGSTGGGSTGTGSSGSGSSGTGSAPVPSPAPATGSVAVQPAPAAKPSPTVSSQP